MNNSNREKILDLIAQEQGDENSMQAHLSRMNSDNSTPAPNNFMTLVEIEMKKKDLTKSQAMRAITAKYPKAHEAWIREVNK